LDKAGNAKQLHLDHLKNNKELNLSNFSHENFRHMCLLSGTVLALHSSICVAHLQGCDYLANIPGVGLMKAHQLISKYKDVTKVCFQCQNLLFSFVQFSRVDYDAIAHGE
jgi:exonuclease-1